MEQHLDTNKVCFGWFLIFFAIWLLLNPSPNISVIVLSLSTCSVYSCSPLFSRYVFLLLSIGPKPLLSVAKSSYAQSLPTNRRQKSKHLALNVISKAVIIFYSPYTAFFGHTDVQDFHYHEKVTPQAGIVRRRWLSHLSSLGLKAYPTHVCCTILFH